MIDMACKVSEIPGFDDNDGLKVVEVGFDAIYDCAWSARPGSADAGVRTKSQHSRRMRVAKNKADLHKEAVVAGEIPADSRSRRVHRRRAPSAPQRRHPRVKRVSASKPIVAPDGHVVLSQEDIDARS